MLPASTLALAAAAAAATRFLVEFAGRLFALLATTAAWPVVVAPGLVVVIVVGRSIPPDAWIGGIFTIGGSQFDFKLVDFIPLLVRALALGNGEELLQAAAGGYGFWCIHGVILASFQSRCMAGGKMA
jgi:hypothetical protein